MASAVPEDGVVGALKDVSLSAGAWDGGVSGSCRVVGASKEVGLIQRSGRAVMVAAQGWGQC